jgi:hypothetical protein
MGTVVCLAAHAESKRRARLRRAANENRSSSRADAELQRMYHDMLKACMAAGLKLYRSGG